MKQNLEIKNEPELDIESEHEISPYFESHEVFLEAKELIRKNFEDALYNYQVDEAIRNGELSNIDMRQVYEKSFELVDKLTPQEVEEISSTKLMDQP